MGCGDKKLSKYLTQAFTAHCNAMICQQVTLSGDEWPKVADAVIKAENYCRDRIVEHLTPYLERFNVRPHTEGIMPDNNRCDFLNTHGAMDLPIEVKGQWHTEVWTAALNQLQNYTREYRAEGRGIYLVLWFGKLGTGDSKNPHGWRGERAPQTAEEMESLLYKKCGKNLSERTKIFVLDVSKPNK